jgi:GntR family transcriptional regulator
VQIKTLANIFFIYWADPLDKKRNLCIIYIYSYNRGDPVNILIDNKSGEPIYNQIYSQIKNQIINGELKEDEMLPSIRGLAKDLRISFITTKRAYEELEKEGFIYTLPAKGCYVAPKNLELLREENLKKIEEHIEKISKLAVSCNLSRDDIIEMVTFCMEEQE